MSLSRQVRKSAARRLADRIIKAYGEGFQLPTVEQLYTIIGAKDGMIYDLQLQLVGLQNEYSNAKARIQELEELTSIDTTPDEIAPVIEEQRQQLNRIRNRKPVEQDEETDLNATFKPH